MVKALVVDFDGVIVRKSEFFKQEAWTIVFSAYGDSYLPHLKKAEEKFGGGRGGDRFDILRETYRSLGEPEEKLSRLVEKGAQIFDEYVQKKISEAGADSEVVQELEKISKRVPIYVNSATPVDALKRAILNLGISRLFRGVLGRPNSKIENFRSAAAAENVRQAKYYLLATATATRKLQRNLAVNSSVMPTNGIDGWVRIIVSGHHLFAELEKHL